MNEKELVNNLINGKNAEIRRLAAEELVNYNVFNFESIKAFAYGLKDTDLGVKDFCTHALLNTPDEYKQIAAESVIKYIESDNIETRNLAGDILLKLGEHSVKPLLNFLDHPDYYVRQFSIDILGQIKDDSVTNYLVKFLDDPNQNVVISTIDALGNLKASNVLEELQILYDEQEEFRPVIIEAYRKIGGNDVEKKLLNILKSEEDIFLKINCIDALAFVGSDPSINLELINFLNEAPEEVHGIILKAIIAISFRTETEINLPDNFKNIAKKSLMDDDPDIRIAGLLALGNSYTEEDVSYLVNEVIQYNDDTQEIILSNLLKNSEPNVLEKFLREYSAICHFDIKHTEFFSLLINLLPSINLDNKERLYKVLFELILSDHVGFSSQVIETLYLGDAEYTTAYIENLLNSSNKDIKTELLDIIYSYKLEKLYDKVKDLADSNDDCSEIASVILAKIDDDKKNIEKIENDESFFENND